MGQKDSYSKEWIELYNNTDNDINLSNWKLKISKTEIVLNGIIAKNSFYLLEHKNDQSVKDIDGNLFYKKALNNKGELLLLVDRNGKEVDKIDCSAGWFSGDNKTKQTMERTDSLENGNDKANWQKSKSEGGTPGEENSKQEKIANQVDDKNLKTIPIEFAKKSSEENIPLTTYFIAGVVATFSAASVLIIKQLSI